MNKLSLAIPVIIAIAIVWGYVHLKKEPGDKVTDRPSQLTVEDDVRSVDNMEHLGRLTLKIIFENINPTPDQKEQSWAILAEECDAYRQWLKTRNLTEREVFRQERELEDKRDRAWYDNDLAEVEEMEHKIAVFRFGEKARPPLQIVYDRVAEILPGDQRRLFVQELDIDRKQSQEMHKASGLISPYVSARYFRYTLPLVILIEEKLAPLNLHLDQEIEIEKNRRKNRINGRLGLREYYESVTQQVDQLRDLHARYCDALEEGDVSLQQQLKKEKESILCTDSLMTLFRDTVDQVEDVLDDKQKETFQPIKEDALRRYADYLDRSMTCENMDIVNEKCEESEEGSDE